MTDVLQQLAQLAGPILKSPQGQQMAQAIMAQMQGGGGDPRTAMATRMPSANGNNMRPPVGAMPDPVGRGPATDGELEAMDQAQSDMTGRPTQMTTEDELAQAQAAMGNQGMPNTGGADQGGGMNMDGPTPEEVQLLKTNPSPRNKLNFDKLFGRGAADMVLQGGGGNTTFEDDVRGAMSDGKGHIGRGEPLDGTILDEDD